MMDGEGDPETLGVTDDSIKARTQVLVKVNNEWLLEFASSHGAGRGGAKLPPMALFIAQQSLWLNDYFQKLRVLTDPTSRQAKSVVQKFEESVQVRNSGGPLHSKVTPGSPCCDRMVEPLALILYCATQDRCSEFRVEPFLKEVHMYMASPSIVARANEAVLATPLYRLLVRHSNLQARILVLKILLVLAKADAAAVTKGCEVGAKGQPILPNMFISTLAKRHPDSEALQGLTNRLLSVFDLQKGSLVLELSYAPPSPSPSPGKTPKKSPVLLSSLSSPSLKPLTAHLHEKSPLLPQPKAVFGLRPSSTLSARRSPKRDPSPPRSIDKPNVESSTHSRKPHVCLAPLDQIEKRLQAFDLAPPHTDTHKEIPKKTCELALPLIHHSDDDTVEPVFLASPPRQKMTSHHTSRELTSVSGFEWWWRTLPPNHTSLTPHAKLKAVCVAAIRMHSAGVFDRAVELYRLALTMTPVPAELHVLPTPEDGDGEPVSLPLKLQLNLGSAALSLGHVSDSIKAFETAIRINPQNPWAHYKLGMAYKSAGRVESAVTEWRAVAKLFPLAMEALDALEHGSKDRRHPVPRGGSDSPKVKAKGSTKTTSKGGGGSASPSTTESKSAKHRVKEAVRHLASMGVHMEIDWPVLFSVVDRYHLGVVTTTAFKEILQVSGLTLTSQEFSDLSRYLRDPDDVVYLSYKKLLADATFAAASHRPTVPLDQMCFHGPRKRTTMENLRVPLHLIAQNECHKFFSTMASWAAFGVSKAIPGAPILHATWLARLLHVPVAPPSVVSAEAAIFVRNAVAAGALQAKHLILVRRRVAKKLSVSLVDQAQYTACAHVSRWRKDGIHNVSVAMGGHVLQCAVARIVLATRVQTARVMMERRSLAFADLVRLGQRARAFIDLQRRMTSGLEELACRARVSIIGRRKSRAGLARTAATAARWMPCQVDAKVILVEVATKSQRRMATVRQAQQDLAEQVAEARTTLDQLRLAAREHLVETTRLIVAQTTVSTILVTMVQAVAATRIADALPVDGGDLVDREEVFAPLVVDCLPSEQATATDGGADELVGEMAGALDFKSSASVDDGNEAPGSGDGGEASEDSTPSAPPHENDLAAALDAPCTASSELDDAAALLPLLDGELITS